MFFMLMNYQAVLFDFDGTLAPNLDLKGMKRQLIEFTLETTKVARADIEKLYILELIDYTVTQLDKQEAQTYFDAAHNLVKQIELNAAQKTSVFPSTKALLRHIRASGLKIGVVTRNCEDAIRNVFPELDDYCDALFARDHVVHLKPDPRHLDLCLAALACDASSSIMVGDSHMDMQAGSSLNMHCIGVLTGSDDQETLTRSGAHQTLDSVADFLAVVTQV